MASFQRPMGTSSNSSLVTILKQTSPFEERVTRNGIQRDIHVVIKNSPFVVQIGVARNCEIDLNHIAFDCSLLYDTDGEKGVDFVKLKPIEYKCVPNEGGDQVSVELRIKVLTSQHEDMFFKVKIQGQDPVTKQDVANLKVITAPIKVISKPEQLKKRQPTAAIPVPATPNPTVPVSNLAIPANPAANAASKKRTVNDLVVEAVTRIEKQQYEQSTILERIMQFVALPKQENPLNPNSSWEFLPPLNKIPRKDDSFETCFQQLLKSFQGIEPAHRAEKVRRVARGLSLVENEALAEFVGITFYSSSSGGPPPPSTSHFIVIFEYFVYMLMTEGLGIEAGREARPTNLYPQHLDVKPPLYAMPPQHHNPMHSSHHNLPTNLGLSMNKSAGQGEMEKIDNYFFASMLPNYGQVNVNVSNGEEGYPDFLTTSPPPNLPLGNSSDFLNM